MKLFNKVSILFASLALVIGAGLVGGNDTKEVKAAISEDEKSNLEVLSNDNFDTVAEYVLQSTDGYYWNGTTGTTSSKWGGITKTLANVARVTIDGTFNEGFSIKDDNNKYLSKTTGNMLWNATDNPDKFMISKDDNNNPIIISVGTSNGLKVNGTSGIRLYTNINYNANTGKSVALYKLPDSNTPQLISITVGGELNKKTQYVENTFDASGLTFTPVYDKENSEPETITAANITWPSLTAGMTSITGTYKGKSVVVDESFGLNVKKDIITKLEISGELTTKEYYIKDSWDFSGLKATATYDSGKTEDVTSSVTWSASKTIEKMFSNIDSTITVTAKKNNGIEDITSSIEIDASSIKVTIPEVVTIDYASVKSAGWTTTYGTKERVSTILGYNFTDLGGGVYSNKYFALNKKTTSYFYNNEELGKGYITNIEIDFSTGGTSIYNVYESETPGGIEELVTANESKATGTATYELSGKNKYFRINVSSADYANVNSIKIYTSSTIAEIDSLSISGNLVKTKYKIGESFDPSGLTITALYTNGSTKDVTNKVIWPELKLGMTSIIGTIDKHEVEIKDITVLDVYTLSIEKENIKQIVEDDINTFDFTYTLKNKDDINYEKQVTAVWTSSNTDVMDIESDGSYWIAYSAGTTTISLSVTDADGYTYNDSISINVIEKGLLVSKEFKEALSGSSFTANNIQFNVDSKSSYKGYDGNRGMQFGSSNNSANTVLIETKNNAFNRSNLKIVAEAAYSSGSSATISVLIGATVISIQNLTKSSNSYIFELDSVSRAAQTINELDTLTIRLTNKNGAVYLKALKVYSDSSLKLSSSVSNVFIDKWQSLRNTAGNEGICHYLSSANRAELDAMLERYEAFSDEDKAIIDAAKDGDTTIGNTITYVKNVIAGNQPTDKDYTNSGVIITSNYSIDSTSLIALFALLGIGAISAYYFIEKKKLSK